MRGAAREIATGVYTEAIRGLFGLIERRIDWRRANAHLLALEARAMIDLLADAPRFVAFRRARIRTWSMRYRRHAARAIAADCLLSAACGVCSAT